MKECTRIKGGAHYIQVSDKMLEGIAVAKYRDN